MDRPPARQAAAPSRDSCAGGRSVPPAPPARTGDARLICLLFALLAAHAAGALLGLRRDAPPALPVAAHRVDVAAASVAELGALPGVGPKLAARIDAERRRRPFSAVSDLRRVPGIGPALLARIAPHAVVGGNGEPGH